MRNEELTQAIASYQAGLEAELIVLRQLERLAVAQQQSTADGDLEQQGRIAQERERLLSGLVAIEHELRPIRQILSEHQKQAAVLGGFAEVLAHHRTAADLVSTIISADQETMKALKDAESARRFAAQSLGRGETTLAAYRRVVAPTLGGATLVDKRG